MSFSGQVKSELCRTLPAQRCCALAQCFGILLYCNTFTGDAVRIVTESRDFAERLPKLFRRAFGLEFDEVILPFADDRTYCTEFDRNLLYVACTRAMHRLKTFFPISIDLLPMVSHRTQNNSGGQGGQKGGRVPGRGENFGLARRGGLYVLCVHIL